MKLNEIKKSQFLTDHFEIERWLREMEVKGWVIKADGSVNVNGDVYLADGDHNHIPVKFNVIRGTFDCHLNKLKSLEFCPSEVNGDFICSDNMLKSLKGGPITVGGDFICDNNLLETLEDAPSNLKGGNFSCNHNRLKSLKGAPSKISGFFNCNDNLLETLEGGPTTVGEFYRCSDNNLISLKGASSQIGGNVYCSNNLYLTSLIGISDIITKISGYFYADCSKIKSGGLGLVLIDGCHGITNLGGIAPFKIIEKYLGYPDKVFECQQELIDAGFEEYAQL